jgi:2-oxoglutarate dehydrogenase E1 component
MSNLTDFSGPNLGAALEIVEQYQRDPQSIDSESRTLARDLIAAGILSASFASKPATSSSGTTSASIEVAVRASNLARLVRELGHLTAKIDPLGAPPPGSPELSLEHHSLTENDLRSLPASIIDGPIARTAPNALVALQQLREAYSGSIGYEDDHIQIAEERSWLREAAENRVFNAPLTPEARKDVLSLLTRVETFERFLHTTFPGKKRFSIEGADMLVPILDEISHIAAASGKREVIMGMAHRGRLNVLTHILGKPYSAVLSEFEHAHNTDHAPSGSTGTFSGDVKYHLGWHRLLPCDGRPDMPITLTPNPSHLEYVNPVVTGRARAAQEDRLNPGKPKRDHQASLCVLIHGDAAFPGQGVVAETLNLGQLPGYRVGGTIHIIANNQIGFTTGTHESRSTLYASDLAKGFEVPIVHVNADDPEACIAVARMAMAYRERFGKDFLIDLVGYRRFGHNEIDEPAYTQPQMYNVVRQHPTVREIWAKRLEEAGNIKAGEADQLIESVKKELTKARGQAQAPYGSKSELYVEGIGGLGERMDTAVPVPRLVELNNQLLALPNGFQPHPKLVRFLQGRQDALKPEGLIDWAHAESLAFAAILADGTPIRFTGQDSQRGTFSQRHLVLHDPETGTRHTPLRSMEAAKASFAVYNSPLSECAVVGFEYGYSIQATETLVLWEAQFGDFSNSAQVIIDQFLVSGYAKWGQTPSMVMLLPHGYEGQGPEHSSARLERFLQLAANDNMRVVNCTTPGQYFHLLRRQAAQLHTAPVPLIVMSPKSLLRYPIREDLESIRRMGSTTSVADLAFGTFEPVLNDPLARHRADKVTRLVLCTGKVFNDLAKHPNLNEVEEHVAIVRIEELYPFPFEELQRVVEEYRNLQEVVWLQEEPRNMGSWRFIAGRIQQVLPPPLILEYVGRPEAASTAEGSEGLFEVEQRRLLTAAISNVPEPKKNAKTRRSSVEDANRDPRPISR